MRSVHIISSAIWMAEPILSSTVFKHSYSRACISLSLTHTHTHKHARTHTRAHKHADTHTHTSTHTRKHAHTRARARTHTRARAHTHTHIHTQARAHTHTHTHAHAHTHTYTHTHTHKHALPRGFIRPATQHPRAISSFLLQPDVDRRSVRLTSDVGTTNTSPLAHSAYVCRYERTCCWFLRRLFLSSRGCLIS